MPALEPASLNYLAIGTAGLASFLLGAVWYTALFGKAWQRANGYSDEQLKAVQSSRPMPVFFGGLFLCYLLAALVLALGVQALNLTTFPQGALLGLGAWVIVAAYGMTLHLANAKPLAAYLIDTGFALVFLPASGAILAAWR